MASRRGRVRFAQEAPRAALEYTTFLGARRKLSRYARGDGRPVLVLPGFVGSDLSTRALRGLLKELGYHVHAWRLGRNWGPTDVVLDGLQERFRTLVETHGRPLTLIGHSLGGIYSREIARAAPGAVRQVITLGSPMRRGPSAVTPLFRALSPLHSERVTQDAERRIDQPLPVPLTAIITRTDGVVPWRICLPGAGGACECIEVRGSHSGLIHNPAAIGVILDRLSLDEWKPYVERPDVAARHCRVESSESSSTSREA